MPGWHLLLQCAWHRSNPWSSGHHDPQLHELWSFPQFYSVVLGKAKVQSQTRNTKFDECKPKAQRWPIQTRTQPRPSGPKTWAWCSSCIPHGQSKHPSEWPKKIKLTTTNAKWNHPWMPEVQHVQHHADILTFVGFAKCSRISEHGLVRVYMTSLLDAENDSFWKLEML